MFLIDDSTFNSTFKIVAGAGADSVFIEQSTSDSVDTAFNGSVNINLGNGDDDLFIGDPTDGANFAAAVTLAGGLDLDFLNALANPNNTGLGAALITGFEEAN